MKDTSRPDWAEREQFWQFSTNILPHNLNLMYVLYITKRADIIPFF